MRARHAQVAIGILIIQDIAAVAFVSLATDEPPSWWALSLIALPLARPILYNLLQRCGHGEILLLAGFFLAVTGGQLFELFGLKAHLGALVFGVLLSGHNKAVELSKALMGFKDIFLIGFFLSIGFTALPTVDMLSTALIMAIALPFKTGMFFLWLTRLKLRSRTAFLASLSLSSYSEFGLIVCSVAVTQGLLAEEWLVIMALAVALSFVFSSLINTGAHGLYARWSGLVKGFEQPVRLPEDEFSQPDNATVLVIGMGRVGTGSYDTLRNEMKRDVCGVDVDRERVAAHCRSGRNVIAGDSEDPDFWAHVNLDEVELIVLAMPNHLDLLEAEHQLQLAGYQGKTAGIARYADEKRELLSAGVDVVFNFYENAGSGLAEHSIHLIE